MADYTVIGWSACQARATLGWVSSGPGQFGADMVGPAYQSYRSNAGLPDWVLVGILAGAWRWAAHMGHLLPNGAAEAARSSRSHLRPGPFSCIGFYPWSRETLFKIVEAPSGVDALVRLRMSFPPLEPQLDCRPMVLGCFAGRAPLVVCGESVASYLSGDVP